MLKIQGRHLPHLMSVSILLTLWLSPFTASAANLTGLSLAPSNPTVQVGKNIQLMVTGSYDDGTQQVIAQAKQVSAGASHTCAVNTNGTVQCWGGNDYGKLGNGTSIHSSTNPITVSGINTAVAVSAGEIHTCAVLADGTVRCWGDNDYGQLGNGTYTDSSTPATVSGITTAVAVSAGVLHSCAVLADGTVQCWGWNGDGQLGNGTSGFNSLIPVTVSGITTAVAVSSGAVHTCALLADGAVKCWGYNGAGRLGNGTTVSSLTPVTVSGITTAVAVSVGVFHSCALLTDGTLRCWGSNYSGQLGNGTFTDSSTPVTVSGITTAVAVSVGTYNHTCALLAEGTVRCWGLNSVGQLGNGTTIYSSTPVTVSGINTAVAVSTGYEHTCAVLTDGTVQCWGLNDFGQLGNGTTSSYNSNSTPATVSGITTAVAVSAGTYNHTCAVLADGTLRCWGYNNYGQLGNGTTTSSSTPVTVSGINTAVAVSTGYEHTCAVLTDGTIKCWGDNFNGQLGNGTYYGWSWTPVTVSGINTAVAVSTGYEHTCAVLADGTLRCWGGNDYGQLGNGMTTNSSTPVAVSGVSIAVAVSAGSYHTCAVLADRTVRCWGWNNFGQLGNGTTSYFPNPIPVTVSGLNTAAAVSAGEKHTCALLTDGTVRCWGANFSGLLGNSTTGISSIPVTVSGINTAVAVSTGYEHTCAVLADGTLRCWGDNYFGQLGNGRSAYYTTPTPTLSYLPVAWNSADSLIASVNGIGQIHATAAGATQITASLAGFSANTTVTVTNSTLPTVTGLWPGTGAPGTFVFVFGSNFVSGQTRVKANTVSALVHVLSPDLLIFILPVGDTTGTVTVTTPSGSATSTGIFGIPPTGLSLTGFWPGTSKVGGFVFVFGSGYVVNQTQVSVNGVSAALRQVLDPNLLIFMVPPGASTGPISVTTPNGSVSSGGVLTVAP